MTRTATTLIGVLRSIAKKVCKAKGMNDVLGATGNSTLLAEKRRRVIATMAAHLSSLVHAEAVASHSLPRPLQRITLTSAWHLQLSAAADCASFGRVLIGEILIR
jgi:hypothetical protein